MQARTARGSYFWSGEETIVCSAHCLSVILYSLIICSHSDGPRETLVETRPTTTWLRLLITAEHNRQLACFSNVLWILGPSKVNNLFQKTRLCSSGIDKSHELDDFDFLSISFTLFLATQNPALITKGLIEVYRISIKMHICRSLYILMVISFVMFLRWHHSLNEAANF